MKVRIRGIILQIGESEGSLSRHAALALGISDSEVTELRISRKSLDARRARPPCFVYTVECSVPDGTGLPDENGLPVAAERIPARQVRQGGVAAAGTGKKVVVVGSGPAGLFAALTLAEHGVSVLVLERGKPVRERAEDVRRFWEKGILDPESNVHFGEGGAGTFSDGKLTSRARNPHTGWIRETLVAMGAPAGILYDAKPHIGTDRLRDVVANIRGRLTEMGSAVRFNAKVTDFLVHRGKIAGLVINGSEEMRADSVILAMGQAAGDTYERLHETGIAMEPKPYAMGVRIEHPQELINSLQYGKWAGHPELPPAEYFITAGIPGSDRSVYTFCMCPGGQVIACSSEAGGVVTNGMSFHARDGLFANSAVVVNVRREDFADNSPLAGLAFRRQWEERAFMAGGGGYRAPAQKVTDFLQGREGRVDACTYLPAVQAAPLHGSLPAFVAEALKKGFAQFERKMPGFITAEATLIGVETRTSSPVRISRKKDGESLNTSGLYPCGEGAGYAGGIVSSALDGMHAAMSFLKKES